MVHKNGTSKFKAIVIIILLAAITMGTGGYRFFYDNNRSSLSSNSANSEYEAAKDRVDTLTQQLNSDPHNINLQQSIGDAYYDLGTLAKKSAPSEAKTYYRQAVNHYQVVVADKQDINVLTDMATAAYFSDQFDLADQSYQKALAINPKFAPALNNYGIFFYEVKKDNVSAIRMWQEALNQDPNGPNSEELKKLINQAKAQ